MEQANGIQKKIVELDPYSVKVTSDPSGEEHPSWESGQEHPVEAGLVPVSVPVSRNARLTVKMPLPVPGKGLSQASNGVVDVKCDPNTMEILDDGSIAAKTAAGVAVSFLVSGLPMRPGMLVLEFDGEHAKYQCDRSSVLVSPDNYPVNRQSPLAEGDMVFPGGVKWLRAEAIFTFTAPKHESSRWEYNCAFVVQSLDTGSETVLDSYEFPFSLDTTEHISVVTCPVSFYNKSGAPIRLRTGVRWDHAAGECTDMGISFDGKVTISAF